MRGPALKQGKPLFSTISTSSSSLSACLRAARNPLMHSTCRPAPLQAQALLPSPWLLATQFNHIPLLFSCTLQLCIDLFRSPTNPDVRHHDTQS